MGNFKILGKGMATASRNYGLLLWLWLIDVAFVLVIVTPAFLLAKKDFGHSLVGGSLGRFRFEWLGDLAYRYQDLLPAIAGAVLVPALLFMGLFIFLNGGIIGRVAAGGKTNLQGFFADCGKYLWRFIRVFLLSLPVYAVVFGGLLRLLAAPLKAWMRNASGEVPVIIASNLQFVITVLILSIVQMFFDYMKVHIVVHDGRKVLEAAAATLSFIGKRFIRAWGLYLLVGLLFIAATAVFIAVTNVLPGTGVAALALGFLWAQAYILARIWIKVLFFATEIDLTRMDRVE